MSQVHNINSFRIRGVCLRAHRLKVNSSHVQQRPGRTFLTKRDGADFITNHQEPLAVDSTAGGKTSARGEVVYS